MLNLFFAVTRTSVFRVEAHGEYLATAVKIALKGSSEIPVNKDICEGGMIAICRNLQAFLPEKYGATHPMTGFERRLEMVNTRYWGLHSSPIIGLFKTEEEAMACFSSEGQQPYDPRWANSTQQVLEEISEEHPSFYISRHSGLELVPKTADAAVRARPA